MGAVLVLLLLHGVPAQGQNKYELRNPSVEEFMQAVPAIVEQAYTDGTDSTIRHVIGQEFDLRYGDEALTTMSFDLLLDFQTTLAIGADPSLPQDPEKWFMALLETGLRDNQVDNFSYEFSLGNFQIMPTPVDFDGDGAEEQLLEIHNNWSGRVFYALFSDHLHSVPLPIIGLHSSVITRALPQTGQLTTRQLADLDGDSGTEWIVEADTYGYWASCGALYVLDWQADQVVNRTRDRFHYCIPLAQNETASIEYLYSQPTHIQMIEMRVDGWNCQQVETDTLNLITHTLNSTIDYAETAWCALREADDAFRAGDYETAANIYEQVVSKFDGQMAQYVYARLVLAYALDNHPEQVQETLQAVTATGQMGSLLQRLRSVRDDPTTMCRIAYEFFVENNHLAEDPHDNPYPWTAPHFHFGHEPEDPRYFPLPVPSQAGCDYQQVMNLMPTPISTVTNVSDQYIASFVQSGIYSALIEGTYQSVLEQIDAILALPESAYGFYTHELAYWRAITLDLMQQSDDTLTQYLAIYEAAPESAWGMLAALHLKAIDEPSSEP
jgi:tetratricopeptide (TPR) repeat protein